MWKYLVLGVIAVNVAVGVVYEATRLPHPVPAHSGYGISG